MRTPEVIQDCKSEIKACNDVSEVRNVLDGYYSKIVWSVEKDEWEKISEEMKTVFCSIVFKKVKGE